MYTLILSLLINATGDPQIERKGTNQEITGGDLTCFNNFITSVWGAATPANISYMNCWRRGAKAWCDYAETVTNATAAAYTTASTNGQVDSVPELSDIAENNSTVTYDHKYPKLELTTGQKTALAACINGKYSVASLLDVLRIKMIQSGGDYYAILDDITYVSHTDRLSMIKNGTCGIQLGVEP